MTSREEELALASVATAAREVEEFVAAHGWDQSPQLFALVSTAALLREQPGLAGQVDMTTPLTPVAQEPMPGADLAEALSSIAWPDAVSGCALAQEIVVLPPSAEAELPDAAGDAEHLRQAAANHPDRKEARLVAAVLRTGPGACVLRLRGRDDPREDDMNTQNLADEIIERPDLAPNLLGALRATFAP